MEDAETAIVNGNCDDTNVNEHISKRGPPWYRSQRYIMAYLLFGGMMMMFYQRFCLSITIICMVNHTAISTSHVDNIIISSSTNNNNSRNNFHLNISDNVISFKETVVNSGHLRSNDAAIDNVTDELGVKVNNESDYSRENVFYNEVSTRVEGINSRYDQDGTSRDESDEGSHDDQCDSQSSKNKENEDGPLLWSKTTQGLLLGALFWTYGTFNIPANWLVQKYRKKAVLLLAMSILTLMTVLTPAASMVSPWLIFAIKLLQGACAAAAMLAMYGLWSKWAPPQERAGLISLSFAGTTFANATVFPFSALLCKYGFLGGWPSVFYVFGLLCIIWAFFAWWLMEECPTENSRISRQECDYIVSSIAAMTRKDQESKAPWGSILRSLPVWAIVCAHTSYTWGLYLFMSTLPLYMFEVLKLDIKSNGLYSMFPYLAFFITSQVAGQLSDVCIRRQIISVLWMRRLSSIITNIIPAVLIIIISFLNCNQATLAIALLTVAVGASGFAFSFVLVNPFDIAPSYAASVMALSNSFATVPGIVAPYFVTAVTKDKTREQWQIVFFTTAAILILGTVAFCVMASANVQPWAASKQGIELLVEDVCDIKPDKKDKDSSQASVKNEKHNEDDGATKNIEI